MHTFSWIDFLRRRSALFSAFVILASFGPASSAHAIDLPDDDMIAIDAVELMNTDDLNDHRGGTLEINSVSARQTMTATSAENTVNVWGDQTNGAVTATFGGNGFGSYVLNSGNNATINSGVNLSVLMMQ